MIIIIKTPPYAHETVLGSLFIGLSTAEQNIDTKVIFLEQGLFNLYPEQNSAGILDIPPISDLIMQFVGLVKFYAIPPSDSEESIFQTSRFSKKNLLPGVKLIDYSKLVDILNTQPKNIVIL